MNILWSGKTVWITLIYFLVHLIEVVGVYIWITFITQNKCCFTCHFRKESNQDYCQNGGHKRKCNTLLHSCNEWGFTIYTHWRFTINTPTTMCLVIVPLGIKPTATLINFLVIYVLCIINFLKFLKLVGGYSGQEQECHWIPSQIRAWKCSFLHSFSHKSMSYISCPRYFSDLISQMDTSFMTPHRPYRLTQLALHKQFIDHPDYLEMSILLYYIPKSHLTHKCSPLSPPSINGIKLCEAPLKFNWGMPFLKEECNVNASQQGIDLLSSQTIQSIYS